uniref:DUF1279 domain-containing protein n=1 Tax=Hemiselmis tepida TaxID=464990 RepID=A0A7S0W563_9CRYP
MPLQRLGGRRGGVSISPRMQMQGGGLGDKVGQLRGEVELIAKTLSGAPTRVSEAGPLPALVEVGELVTGTEVYRTYAQGAVLAFLGSLHVAAPELLQSVGTFHLVCLPVALAAAYSKGHDLGPAAARTLLIGGLGAAQVVFATDGKKEQWPWSGAEGLGSAGAGAVASMSAMDMQGGMSQPAAESGFGKEKESKESLIDTLKGMVKEYGKAGLLCYILINLVVYAIVYGLVTSFGDVTVILDTLLPLLPESVSSHVDASAGNFAATFLIVKVTAPLRWVVEIALIPRMVEVIRQTPLAQPLGLRPLEESS